MFWGVYLHISIIEHYLSSKVQNEFGKVVVLVMFDLNLGER